MKKESMKKGSMKKSSMGATKSGGESASGIDRQLPSENGDPSVKDLRAH